MACRLRDMAVAHRIVIRAALCLCLMTVHGAFAQEKLSVNRSDEALALARRAVELDPLNPGC